MSREHPAPGERHNWTIIKASGLDAIPFATTARLALLNRYRAARRFERSGLCYASASQVGVVRRAAVDDVATGIALEPGQRSIWQTSQRYPGYQRGTPRLWLRLQGSLHSRNPTVNNVPLKRSGDHAGGKSIPVEICVWPDHLRQKLRIAFTASHNRRIENFPGDLIFCLLGPRRHREEKCTVSIGNRTI